jgi:hypothetical protein
LFFEKQYPQDSESNLFPKQFGESKANYFFSIFNNNLTNYAYL